MARPACILFLLDWRPLFWSTREEFFRQLCRRLHEAGIQPLMVVSAPVADDVRQRLEEAGARLESCSYHAHPWRYWRRIRGVARQYSVRLVHVRFFDYFTAVLWMSRLAGAGPVIFTDANSGEWNGRGWKAAAIRLRAAVMCRPLARVIAISQFIRGRLMTLGIPEPKIRVVYNGVDTQAFRPDAAAREELRRQMEAGPGTVVLIFAATLLEWKRPEIALQVAAELAGRSVDIQLWMAGDGPLRPQLEALAAQLGLSGRVLRWLGHQRKPERWLAAADLFLHTARGEAFGNVLVEAMACGLPVVALRSGALPELVAEDGEEQTGVLVAEGPGQVRQLADQVQRLSGDGPRYRAMAAAAIRRAARFNTAASVEQTLAVYDELWSGRRGRPQGHQ